MFKTQAEKLDRRIIRTRTLLREAFMDLMQEKHFQQLTVQDITDRAMINRATFYAHFEDKYALFDYTTKTMFQEHLERNMLEAEGLTYTNLRLLSQSTLTFLSQFIEHCAPTERNNDLPFEKQIRLHLRDILLQWLDDSGSMLNPDNISTDLIATASSSTIFASVLYYARGNSSLSQEDYIDQLMTLLINGVCLMASE